MPSQPASVPVAVPLTFQLATYKHLRAMHDFGLFTNQPKFIASICQAEELLETEQCSKTYCFKQTITHVFILESDDFR